MGEMKSLQIDIQVFRNVIREGQVPRAYQALLAYMQSLRSHFDKLLPDATISELYQGSMDATYFAISPPDFKRRDLKIAVVFNYETFHFELWLAGKNKQINRHYWEELKDLTLKDYLVIEPAKGISGFIVVHLLFDADFSDANRLTLEIESAIASFTVDMSRILVKIDRGF